MNYQRRNPVRVACVSASDNSRMVQQLWRMKGAIALAITVAFLPACTYNRPEATAPASPTDQGVTASASPGTTQDNVTTEDVTDRTAQLIGKTVTIRSEALQKVGSSSFTVNDEQFFGSQPILIVNATGKPFTLPANQGTEVQVTGEVQRFVRSNVERDYNLDLQPDLYTNYENQPAIIAQAIALAPKPGEITQNPQQYYNKTLAVTGEVENVRNANAFTLDEDQLLGANDLLVIRAPSNGTNTAIDDGETAAVTGVLRPFVVADLERDYGFNWDTGVQQQLEAEYRNKPVLIANTVYQSEDISE